jgi:glycosyltransferase involved in cell wall biosynthesis
VKLAYFSPLPPQRSGIADYSAELLPYLARYAAIDLFVDGYVPASPEIRENFACHDASDFERLRAARGYDACLYQMGNSAIHAYAYRNLLEHPGVVVLHDYALHHLVVAMTAARGDEDGYVREMGYAHGRRGIDAARWAIEHDHQFPYDEFPANRRVLDASLGLIVHSDYVRCQLERDAPDRPVAVVRQPMSVQDRSDAARWEIRASLGLRDEEVLFGAMGLVTPPKRLDVGLRAFRRARDALSGARLVVVGEGPAVEGLRRLAADLGIGDSVTWTGYVDKARLPGYLDAVDVGINLRWPIVGETSASLLRLLGAGRSTIVSDVGAFREFPDACCWKVPVDASEEGRVVEAMLALGRDAARRQSMGEAARRYVREHHSTESAARAYVGFIDKLLGG